MLMAKAPDQDSARRDLLLEVAKCSMLPRSQGFSPLSDEDEDNEEMGNFTLGDLDDHSHEKKEAPKEKSAGGHFISGAQSTAGMRPQATAPKSSSGAFGEALAAQGRPNGGQGMQDTLQAIKSKSLGLASFLREKAGQASSSVADPNSRAQTINKVKVWGAGAAEKVQTATVQGWQQARDLTAEGLKKFYGGPLAAICKQETAQRPCPRTILVCCTALVTGGLYHEDLFKEEAPQELVHYLLGAFEEGQGLVMPPPGTSPSVIANVLKQFLRTLPEPLLTYKALPAVIAAGQEAVPVHAPEALAELPAASLNSLSVLLEVWHRVAENSATNGMDAHALAVVLAPCLAWNPPPRDSARKGYISIGVPEEEGAGSWRRGVATNFPESASEGGPDSPSAMARSELDAQDLAAVVSVMEYAITNFRAQSRGGDSPLYGAGTANHF